MTFFIALQLVMRSVNPPLWVNPPHSPQEDRCQTTNFGRIFKFGGEN
jgi:hypothetical protein